jgi:hypothetical protein
MTSKQIFEYALVELNKKEAPSLLLEDYNYFINKGVNQYINKMYNIYDVNQQKTDDLRVLKSTAVISPTPVDEVAFTASSLLSNAYEVDLPDDYLHILNCVVEYDVLANYKCYNAGEKWQQGAKRLTADMFSQIINNYYLRPTYKNPYYYINNVNVKNTYITSNNQVDVQPRSYIVDLALAGAEDTITVTVGGVSTVLTYTTDFTTAATLKTAIDALDDDLITTVDGTTVSIPDNAVNEVSVSGALVLSITPSSSKSAEIRYGNKTKVRMEIRYGKDNSVFELKSVYIDYIKAPQFIRLTQEQVDEVTDNSQVLEFPDYVCQEIVNELIMLLMENSSDPRIQTHVPLSQSVANPAQQQKEK